MILFITLGCIGALLGCLVITPIQLIIHSTTDEYKLNWGWLLRVQLIPLPDDLMISIGFPFYHKDIYPLHPGPTKKTNEKAKKPKKSQRKSSKKGYFNALKTFRSIIRTFKIRQFKLVLDTDDYLVNAWLYPLFYSLNYGKGEWHINYNGQFEFHLEMANRPIRILYVLMKAVW